jgi:tyrosyl-tRNA synthetase
VNALDLIKRGVATLVNEGELIEKIKRKRSLRVKLGMDPTSPDIHLGHVVVLQKMRDFQDLGHKAVLIIGDYTAMIGDPSGENKTRPMLSPEEIKRNAETYLDQAGKILDLSKDKFELRYNSEWLSELRFADIVRLASCATVARMMERDTFEKRYKAGIPIGVHEFLYPLMQGYDSVMVDADVELGGTDQTYNNLFGRDVQRAFGKEEQVVITMPILVGLDGVQKMSKSKGNYIGITDQPQDMFGKIMSISDELMWSYFELVSRLSPEEIRSLKDIHPMEAKKRLAFELVSRFHGEEAAKYAKDEFERVFSKRDVPSDITEDVLDSSCLPIPIVELLVQLRMVSSKSEGRRLIEQGGVYIDGVRVNDVKFEIRSSGVYMIKVGRFKFRRVKFN